MHVPGWHESTKTLQADGAIRMVGIVEEQHGDRARLFMQWQGMEWPVMVDALNLLEVPYVPITLCIDEHGVVRKIAPPFSSADGIVAEFIEADYPSDAQVNSDGREPAAAAPPPLDTNHRAWGAYAARATVNPQDLDGVIEAYEARVARSEATAWDHFRAGVLYRMRYDSDLRKHGDFQKAARKWTSALELNPNNYIMRRRIEQYGPRLAKPYPFYSWVEDARRDILERGEEPQALVVEPGQSEIAGPGSAPGVATEAAESPDPDGRIERDLDLIAVETAVVPATVRPGTVARVHIEFVPSDQHDAHWNNEVGKLEVWVDPPPKWRLESQRFTTDSPRDRATSRERRSIEFDIACPEDGTGIVAIPAYALYYVCVGAAGACLYRRQDIELRVAVRPSTPNE